MANSHQGSAATNPTPFNEVHQVTFTSRGAPAGPPWRQPTLRRAAWDHCRPTGHRISVMQKKKKLKRTAPVCYKHKAPAFVSKIPNKQETASCPLPPLLSSSFPLQFKRRFLVFSNNPLFKFPFNKTSWDRKRTGKCIVYLADRSEDFVLLTLHFYFFNRQRAFGAFGSHRLDCFF